MSVLKNHFNKVCELTKSLDFKALEKILKVILEIRDRGGTIFIFGNGGSAATAIHMATDFSKTKEKTGKVLKALSLCTNQGELTAIANDIGYDNVFSFQLENFITENDLVIGISASGNSSNCIKAFNVAKSVGAKVIGILGFDGGEMKKISDYCFHINIDDYFYAEDLHMIFSHALTRAIRESDN